MGNYDNWRELATDLQLDNNELRQKVGKLEYRLGEAKTNLRHAIAKLRDAESTTEPYEVDEDEYECGECNIRLEPEWFACAGCGRVIDWERVHPLDGRNWYAEEGEDFLRREVYEPLRRSMR